MRRGSVRTSFCEPFNRIAIVLLIAITAGCASPQIAPSKPVATQTIERPAQSFSVSGRFSAKRSESAASGQFRYVQRGLDRTLEIFTPTSTPLARIDATAQSATLSTADGVNRSAATLGELLRMYIVIELTDAQFSAWLQGLPASGDGVKAIERDPQSRLYRFTESNWMIEISARGDSTPPFARRMRWAYAPETDTELRWVIDEFTVP